MAKSNVLKKIGKITLTVITCLFLAICIFAVIATIAFKKDPDGTVNVFGYQMRLVVSPSMEKCEHTDVSKFEIKDIPVKSVVFVKVVPEDKKDQEDFYAALKVGDVLTFKYTYTTQETITHRITNIEIKSTGGYVITLRGDNINSEGGALEQVIDTSESYSTNYVIGKVTGKSLAIGSFIYALKTPVGLILMVIIPALAIASVEVVRIVKVLTADKNQKQKEEKEELEMLREKLKQLESEKNNAQ